MLWNHGPDEVDKLFLRVGAVLELVDQRCRLIEHLFVGAVERALQALQLGLERRSGQWPTTCRRGNARDAAGRNEIFIRKFLRGPKNADDRKAAITGLLTPREKLGNVAEQRIIQLPRIALVV